MSEGPAVRSKSIAAWLLALAPAAMLMILLARPMLDVDAFRQSKLGESIVRHGGPLGQEPPASTHLNARLPAPAWLGQAVMANVRLLAGWAGLRVFDALCWLGGFLAIAAACRKRSGSAAGVLLALAIAFVAALPTAGVRPQSFAALCFGALLALLRLELKPWQITVLAVPLFLVWQNLHPSVGVAALTLGVLAALGWRRRFAEGGVPPWEFTLLALIAGAMNFVTPDGLAIVQVFTANASASAAMRVGESLPLWAEVNRFEAVPVLSVAVVVTWVLLRNPRRIDAGELAVAIALFALTVCAYRFVLFWAIALIPVVARAVPPPPRERRIPAWLAPGALVAVAIALPLLRETRFADTDPLARAGALRTQDGPEVLRRRGRW